MKIVRIFGGLGNQMFQYALAIALQEHLRGELVAIDCSIMRGYPLHNGYEIDRIFGTRLRQASNIQIAKVAWILPNYRLWQLGKRLLPCRKNMIIESASMKFIPEIFTPHRNLMIEGYWQSERYFVNSREAVLRAFSFPRFEHDSKNEYLSKKFIGKNVVGIHVRRGDYLNIPNTLGICDLGYYRRAIHYIKEMNMPDMFVIFSDEIEWCQKYLCDEFDNTEAIYVNWNKGLESFRDMQLMSLCSHNIIANSSFSWWGAWLNCNPNKIVIAPYKWMNSDGWSDIIPDNWTKIK